MSDAPVGVFPALQVGGPARLLAPEACFVVSWNGGPATLRLSPRDVACTGGAPAWSWHVDAAGSPYLARITLLEMTKAGGSLIDREGREVPLADWSGDEDFRVWPSQEWEFTVPDTQPLHTTHVEQSCHDPSVLSRHYQRPLHMLSYNSPGRTPAALEAFHLSRIRQLRRFLRVYARDARVVVDVSSGASLVRMATDGHHEFLLICTDADRPALSVARDSDDRIAVIEATADAVPLEAECADFVYAGEVIEHVPDPHQALQEWIRLVRQGGFLAITTPQSSHLLNRLRGARVKDNKEHLYEWTWAELLQLVWSAGLEEIQHEGLYIPLVVRGSKRGWYDLLASVGCSRWADLVGRLAAEAGRLPKLGKRVAIDQALVLRRR
jgi:SAM-dependent methyltransferase